MFLSKNGLFFAFLSIFLFFSNSTGFDFYSHAVSYYFYEESLNNTYLLFDRIALPRYLFLSVLYEVFSSLGVPLGWLSLALIAFPVYCIFSTFRDFRCHFFDLLLIVLVVILTFFYSGLSLVVLWLVAYVYTKKTLFLIGGLFHPLGIVFFVLFLFFYSLKSLLIFVVLFLFSFLFLMAINMEFKLFTSMSYYDYVFKIDFNSLVDLFLFSYEKKRNELFVLLLFSFVLFFSYFIGRFGAVRGVLNFFERFLCFRFFYVKILSSVVVLVVAVYMSKKPGLISFLFTYDNDPVYISWFDFGHKDLLQLGHYTLYCKRYWNDGCE